MIHNTRQDNAYRELADAGLDSLVCYDSVSLRWLTGFSGSTATCIVNVSEATTTLIVDPRYTASVVAMVERSGAGTKVIEAETRADGLKIIGEHAKGKVGLVSSNVTLAEANQLTRAGIEFESLETDPLLGLRLIKDDAELANMRAALAAAEEGFIAAAKVLEQSGSTEIGVRSALESGMLAAGAEEVGFSTIVASGPNSLSPHSTPTDRVIEDGEFVIIDFGGAVNGYKSDTSRTLWRGELSADQVKVYEAVETALQRATAAIAPGATYGQVKEAADEVLIGAGYGDYMLHPFGHNIGLEAHERPYFTTAAPDGDTELVAGHVVALEPAVYVPEVGGVRIENLIAVTNDGCEVMNSLPVNPV